MTAAQQIEAPRHRGRVMAAETIAQTVEGWQYDQLAENALALENVHPFWRADCAEDETRNDIRRLCNLLRSPDLTRRGVHEIAARIERACNEGDRHDAAADERAKSLIFHVETSGVYGRHVTAWVESFETGQQRHRPTTTRRPAASQMPLGIGDES